MKIVVSATRHPHALSRGQVEAVLGVLPPALLNGIQVVSLETGPWHAGRCEYDAKGHRLRLALVVPEKTPDTLEQGIRLLLDGLARRDAGAPFFERVRRGEDEYAAFVSEWLPRCVAAAS